jgi:hypothetical protein
VPAHVGRVVALGASNLTRGFQTVVSSARASWGPEVEVLAALGHGRSYGATSQFLIRTLPGILECGLWRELESRPQAPTRALLTDVGNDILYGSSAPQILEWIAEALGRLQRTTTDIVLTDLPLANIQRLSEAKFRFVRSVFAPSCRLSLTHVRETAESIDAGLAELAVVHGARFCHLKPDWYGFDPIHIRPSLWRPAWQDILGVPRIEDAGRGARLESANLHLMPAERQWWFGREQVTPQSGRRLPAGSRVWLF